MYVGFASSTILFFSTNKTEIFQRKENSQAQILCGKYILRSIESRAVPKIFSFIKGRIQNYHGLFYEENLIIFKMCSISSMIYHNVWQVAWCFLLFLLTYGVALSAVKSIVKEEVYHSSVFAH
jgi:hypothetical protein